MRLRRLLAAVVVLSACGRATEPAPTLDPTSKRTPPAGTVVGFTGQYGSHEWRGLPYAQPPVGALRWRAPEKLPPWGGTREALAEAPVCPQIGTAFAGIDGHDGEVVGSEDCLVLTVYAPKTTPDAVPSGDARLPVMVWIHGGGNVVGHAGFYDGGKLAETHDVVVVAINYRLGPLGWMRHAALRAGNPTPEGQSGNFGILDQILALEWVRDNIAAFGGDPDNVTIFGESAGARDVLHLLGSPKARGLFHRAIAQSGGLRTTSLAAAENPRDAAEPGHRNSASEILARVMVADGTAADAAAARARLAALAPAEVAAYFRGVPPTPLLEAYATERHEGLIDVPQMFPDGVVLAASPLLDVFATPGAPASVPVMLGTNRDEMKLFMYVDPQHVGTHLFGLLTRAREPAQYAAIAEHTSDMWKAAGADEPAAALVRGQSPGVYVYRFDWDEEPTILGTDLPALLGAAHAFEIPFVFGHWDLGGRANVIFTDDNAAAREALATRMMSYWAAFAHDGAPGRGRDGQLLEWPAGPAFMVFDTDAGGGLRLSDETLSEEKALTALLSDPRLAAPEARCRALRSALSMAGRLRDSDPAGFGCPASAADEPS